MTGGEIRELIAQARGRRFAIRPSRDRLGLRWQP
jgi:hypothetical protein